MSDWAVEHVDPVTGTVYRYKTQDDYDQCLAAARHKDELVEQVLRMSVSSLAETSENGAR